MEDVLEQINQAAKGAFPNSITKYKSVNVLLLSWEDDDLGVEGDVLELKKLFVSGYGFDAEHWKIPSMKPDFKLSSKLLDFVTTHETPDPRDSLLIIYYAGHGYLNPQRQSVWSCRSWNPYEFSSNPVEVEPPSVEWHAHEAICSKAEMDVLFLYDCCSAAGSASKLTKKGIKEVIAASGFETWAPGELEHSFTRALIQVLGSLSRARPFTVASLHQRVLEKLQRWSPQIDGTQFRTVASDGRLTDIERRKTPVHIALNQQPDYYHSSIQLVGLLAQQPGDSSMRSDERFARWKDGTADYTDVIISLRIQAKHNLEPEQIAEWIRDVPMLAMSIKVHAVVHTSATLVLLAIPVAVWDLLPANVPCSFVGFANTSNLMFGKEHLFIWDEEERMRWHSDSRQHYLVHKDRPCATDNLRKW
ncbi:hypothetical protein ONS95_007410 [Cadophora gregata]|uniref:uncharacterized protein n=1 Tax=Cadophora gregata TaxID=51156 RepID=UPI0026DCF8CA|nr:uncharacterized protein ONS95_007410 [Cadophora gregata]KAK0118519.1 hypothetical protein ONS96_011616 [Cadophora gregata f. sp. sojae]KAK0125777.1 hypothetical protein ONS95_007410 [Cadophora gregata]